MPIPKGKYQRGLQCAEHFQIEKFIPNILNLYIQDLKMSLWNDRLIDTSGVRVVGKDHKTRVEKNFHIRPRQKTHIHHNLIHPEHHQGGRRNLWSKKGPWAHTSKCGLKQQRSCESWVFLK